jgi:LytS/YehU family sensor histidine kinase
MFLISVFTVSGVIRFRKQLKRENLIAFTLYTVTTLVFSILQAYLKKIIFLHIGVMFSALIIYVTVYIRNYMEASAEREKLADLKIRLLQSQMNPHFLSNTMNTIYHLCRTEPEKAMEGINALSVLLRNHMDFTAEDELIPFEKEMESVRYYCSLEQMRMGDGLHVVYMIDDTDFEIPPFSVQVFVENAIRHGFSGKSSGTVSITVRKHPEKIEINITDNGRGFVPDSRAFEGRHYGIRGAKDRLEKLLNAEVQINSVIDTGTVVLIGIPL